MFLRLFRSFQYIAKAENLLNSKPAAHPSHFLTQPAGHKVQQTHRWAFSDDPHWKHCPLWQSCPAFLSRFFPIVCIASWHSTCILFTYHCLLSVLLISASLEHATMPSVEKVLRKNCWMSACTNFLFQMTALQMLKIAFVSPTGASLGKIFSVPSIPVFKDIEG